MMPLREGQVARRVAPGTLEKITGRSRQGPEPSELQMAAQDNASKFMESAAASERTISFGPFRLLPTQRLLLDADKPVRLGSRALDILIALVERPGELVRKDTLMARVWPDTLVVEANLTVHVAALRRALGDGHGGKRYLVTIPGRGYRFVAPVTLAQERRPVPQAVQAQPRHNLPALLTRLIGRADSVNVLVAQLQRQRLVTIVGPGGIGKTSVALAVAERLIVAYEHGVWLIDLAPLGDPLLVPAALASALGLEIRSDDQVADLLAVLRGKQMLLVLDNCEHVIAAAAALAAEVLRRAPGVHILATSREPLRAEGERVHRLSSLKSPPASDRLTAAEALGFPSVQLFVERAAATVNDFEFSDADAPMVADICRKLDGIALAIEFAAARVETLGVRGIAAHLDDRLSLLTSSRRIALPRQRTMGATLDWSYGLLTAAEQTILRRLSVFAGGFTLLAAAAVAGDESRPESETIDHVASLVSKSLVAADVGDDEPRLRLLDTARAYALTKLAASGETDMLGRRHAEYYRDLLEAAAKDEAGTNIRPAAYAAEIDNLRAALAWAFAPAGDTALGVALAAASVPLWLELSLLTECHVWTARAVASLDDGRGTRHEMVLQAALGVSLMFTKGMTTEAHAALTQALRLADSLSDGDYQLRILTGLSDFCVHLGDFRGVLALARRCDDVAKAVTNPLAVPTADLMLGIALHFLGDQARAQAHIARALSRPAPALRRPYAVRFGVDQRVNALNVLANVLWLRGLPDQASRAGRTGIDEAQTLEHPVSLCLALEWGGSTISLRTGNLDAAARYTEKLVDHAEKHSLGSYYAVGIGFEGQLSTKRGDVETGVRLLRASLDGLRQTRHQTFYAVFLSDLARAVAAGGYFDESLSVIEEALERAERDEELWYLPEVLRIKGRLLLLQDPSNATAAEDHFLRSLDCARRQGALSWELRAATSLARLRRDQGRVREAHESLATVYGRFTEGFGTADLKTAQRLLKEFDLNQASTGCT